ncbi:MAG: hypothetical protein N4A35_05405 [Flavobacteriales bacterium]|jgi:ABC-type transport system involved in cytochrome bd biosynthesis fused ATPase/permease subunit|nr:hypothetical protein [Flavobacteriales bacterium]
MSKKYSQSELKELAQPVFKENQNVDFLLATRDGQFFLPGKKFAAHNHASANGGLTIHKIENPLKSKEESSDQEQKTSTTEPKVKTSTKDASTKVKAGSKTTPKRKTSTKSGAAKGKTGSKTTKNS